MSDFVAPNTEYMEGKLKILWFPKITNVKEVQTVLPMAPWQLKELIEELLKTVAEYSQLNREEFLETVKKAQTSQQSSEITRLKNRLAEPKYAELCRRFLADSEDFCEENLKQAGMTLRFENVDFEECVSKVCKYIDRVMLDTIG